MGRHSEKSNWNSIMNHGMYALAARWFANICPFFNKCYGFHSGPALASFVIVYFSVNGVEYVHCLKWQYVNVYGTVALRLAWEIRVLLGKKGESQASHTARRIQMNHYDVYLEAFVWLLYMFIVWLSPLPSHSTSD